MSPSPGSPGQPPPLPAPKLIASGGGGAGVSPRANSVIGAAATAGAAAAASAARASIASGSLPDLLRGSGGAANRQSYAIGLRPNGAAPSDAVNGAAANVAQRSSGNGACPTTASPSVGGGGGGGGNRVAAVVHSLLTGGSSPRDTADGGGSAANGSGGAAGAPAADAPAAAVSSGGHAYILEQVAETLVAASRENGVGEPLYDDPLDAQLRPPPLEAGTGAVAAVGGQLLEYEAAVEEVLMTSAILDGSTVAKALLMIRNIIRVDPRHVSQRAAWLSLMREGLTSSSGLIRAAAASATAAYAISSAGRDALQRDGALVRRLLDMTRNGVAAGCDSYDAQYGSQALACVALNPLAKQPLVAQGAIRCGMDALTTCSRMLALKLGSGGGAGADTNTHTVNTASGGTRTASGLPCAGAGATAEGHLGAPVVAWGEASTSGARPGPGGGGAAAAAAGRRTTAVIRTAVYLTAMLTCLAVDTLGRDQMNMLGVPRLVGELYDRSLAALGPAAPLSRRLLLLTEVMGTGELLEDIEALWEMEMEARRSTRVSTHASGVGGVRGMFATTGRSSRNLAARTTNANPPPPPPAAAARAAATSASVSLGSLPSTPRDGGEAAVHEALPAAGLQARPSSVSRSLSRSLSRKHSALASPPQLPSSPSTGCHGSTHGPCITQMLNSNGAAATAALSSSAPHTTAPPGSSGRVHSGPLSGTQPNSSNCILSSADIIALPLHCLGESGPTHGTVPLPGCGSTPMASPRYTAAPPPPGVTFVTQSAAGREDEEGLPVRRISLSSAANTGLTPTGSKGYRTAGYGGSISSTHAYSMQHPSSPGASPSSSLTHAAHGHGQSAVTFQSDHLPPAPLTGGMAAAARLVSSRRSSMAVSGTLGSPVLGSGYGSASWTGEGPRVSTSGHVHMVQVGRDVVSELQKKVSNNKTSIFTESPAVAATYSARCSSAARPQSTSSGVHKLDLPFHLVRPPSGEPTAANGRLTRTVAQYGQLSPARRRDHIGRGTYGITRKYTSDL